MTSTVGGNVDNVNDTTTTDSVTEMSTNMMTQVSTFMSEETTGTPHAGGMDGEDYILAAWKIAVIAIAAVIAASLVILLVCCLCRKKNPTIQRMRQRTNSHLDRIKSTFQKQAVPPASQRATSNSAQGSEEGSGPGLEPQEARAQVDRYQLTDERRKPKTPAAPEVTGESSFVSPKDTMSMTKPREGQTEAPPPKPHSNIRVPGYIGMAQKTGLSEKASQASNFGSSEKIDTTDRKVPKPPDGQIHLAGTSPAPSPHLSSKSKNEYVNSLVKADSNANKDKIEEQENYENAATWISQSTQNLPSSGPNAGQDRRDPPKSAKPLPIETDDGPPTSPAPQVPKYGNAKVNLKATVPVSAPEPDDVYENTQTGSDTNKPGYQNIQAIVDHERKGSSKGVSPQGPGYMNITSMTANQQKHK